MASEEPKWVDDLRGRVGDRSEAIREALDDLAAVVGETAASTWTEMPPPWQSTGWVTVYVVADGWLHRLRGDQDPEKRDDDFRSECEYEAFALSPRSRFSLLLSSTPGSNGASGVVRHWVFQVGDQGEEFSLENRPSEVSALEDDPSAFARALAGEIAKAGRGRRGPRPRKPE